MMRAIYHAFMLLLSILLFLLPTEAEAHRFAPSLLKFVQISDDKYNVVWKTPTEATSNIPLHPIWPVGCIVATENSIVREGTGTVSSWILDCATLGAAGLVGQKLGVSGLAENQASAMIMLNLNDGRRYQSVVNSEATEFLIAARPSQSKVMREYSVLGAKHIWEGPDHLMFVFGLLLLVGGGARLLWTITAFTVGHSVTLALATLGFLTYPVSLIEFAIAVSIFILALELTKIEDTGRNLFQRYPWWLAGGFGLLHGMGFAGALSDIGLPQSNVPLALLFFNVGIEIGQIAFVVPVLVLWWMVNRPMLTGRYTLEKLFPVPVYLLGGLSAMWCFERGLEWLA